MHFAGIRYAPVLALWYCSTQLHLDGAQLGMESSPRGVIILERLSRPIDEMLSHYSVVVVGSGYGGAINAARIARAGQDVCILERGKELHPGEYPRSSFSALRQVQWHTPTSNCGSRTGMFDFHVGPDMSILVGCGLGGTSLINANVALEPDPSIF